MEVLLVEPPAVTNMGSLRVLGSIGTFKADMAWPPLDLMIISGLLKEHKISSTIYDANTLRATFTDLSKKVQEEDPKMVVFTTSTTSIMHDAGVAKAVKEVSEDILTVAIGTHVMALPEETLKEYPYIDVCVYSEPELPVLDIIKEGYKLENIKGISYRKGSDIIKTTPHTLCHNMDAFGFPSHDKIPLELYRDPLMRKSPMTITYGQRGCINRCTYCCSTFYGPLRHRSIDHLIGELKWIEELGIKEIRFFDMGFTNNLGWAEKLLNKMKVEGIKLTWNCNARSDRLPDELLVKMKEAGCHAISIGGESGDPTILKNVKKNVTPELIKSAVERTRRAGISPMVYFMMGLPGETRETAQRTINFAKEINPDIITFGVATPHPGTEFHNYIKENKYFGSYDWSQYDPNKKPVFSYPEFSADEIYETMKHGYQSFYLRPSYV
ncbi:MAG TPA: B12-binding domain-containing radical SAM protein, partial [Candidatus Avalokitesvara rifleensis]|uniref:B12-binding domain-containing radical SAM protein n=1 Tax=Candidatus Avalokitesvara rifleensis TaxID=3367620 RepID=UPI004029BD02